MIRLLRGGLPGVVALLLVAVASAARGQEDVGRSPTLDDLSPDPLDRARSRARAHFALTARTAEEVRREWRQAAREALCQEFERIGEQITADDWTLQEKIAHLLAADQAQGPGAAGEALRRFWELQRRCDAITEQKFRGGNTKLSNHLHLRAVFLAAALRLRQAGQGAGARPWLWDEPGSADDPLDQDRDRARALHAALEADPAALHRQRFDAARLCLALELQRVGEQITADDPALTHWAEALAEAARALRGPGVTPAPVLDVLVELARQSAEITDAKLLAGNTGVENALRTRYLFVKALLDRRQARGRDSDEGIPVIPPPGPPWDADPGWDLDEARARARSRHEQEGRDSEALARQRLHLAETGYALVVGGHPGGTAPTVRVDRNDPVVFVASLGPGWSRRLWEAEAALAPDRPSLLAAHLAYWDRELAAERALYRKVQGGNARPGDYLAARSRRLEAELAYIELRDQKPPP